MKILLATSNPGKFKEMMEVLDEVSEVQFVSLNDLHLSDQPDEHGDTHRANAEIKARCVSTHARRLPNTPVL